MTYFPLAGLSCDGKDYGIVELEPLHPIQIERFRSMTFQEKMAIARRLFRMAWRARIEAFRKAQPGLDDTEYHRLVAAEFAGART